MAGAGQLLPLSQLVRLGQSVLSGGTAPDYRGPPQVPKPLPSSDACLLPSPPATAPQQEADTEVNAETLNKSSSQGTSSSTQAAPPETASTSKDKETSAEKSKDGGSVSIRT